MGYKKQELIGFGTLIAKDLPYDETKTPQCSRCGTTKHVHCEYLLRDIGQGQTQEYYRYVCYHAGGRDAKSKGVRQTSWYPFLSFAQEEWFDLNSKTKRGAEFKQLDHQSSHERTFYQTDTKAKVH